MELRVQPSGRAHIRPRVQAQPKEKIRRGKKGVVGGWEWVEWMELDSYWTLESWQLLISSRLKQVPGLPSSPYLWTEQPPIFRKDSGQTIQGSWEDMKSQSLKPLKKWLTFTRCCYMPVVGLALCVCDLTSSS